ncbi:hypothetical protein A3709_20810 [Halioglobus sp. HI00S01]|uniref:hypothetical protein n=1 Tax=Halioglobus sp. HI00S01 TaxID=1822214 RepID=UPI0007C25C15|nr:hypothetical protein [Halioglobus sp. HI00S01]KZX58056.1 hypothetical protein A3709_20810 [Halioglobus sp. HI00S01]
MDGAEPFERDLDLAVVLSDGRETSETVEEALESEFESVREMAAASCHISQQSLTQCLSSDDLTVRRSAASNPTITPQQSLYVLLNEEAQEVRTALLLNWHCPSSLLGRVLRGTNDFSTQDRYCAALNLSTPIADISEAIYDPVRRVSEAALLHPLIEVDDETTLTLVKSA